MTSIKDEYVGSKGEHALMQCSEANVPQCLEELAQALNDGSPVLVALRLLLGAPPIKPKQTQQMKFVRTCDRPTDLTIRYDFNRVAVANAVRPH